MEHSVVRACARALPAGFLDAWFPAVGELVPLPKDAAPSVTAAWGAWACARPDAMAHVNPAVRRLRAVYAEKLADPALDGPGRGAHHRWELPVEPAEEQALCRLAAARFAARSCAAQVESEPLGAR